MASAPEISGAVKQRVNAELRAGESVAWMGMAQPIGRGSGFISLLFAVVAAVGTYFLLHSLKKPPGNGAGFVVPAFVFVFVMTGWVQVKNMLRRDEVYVITNQRAIKFYGRDGRMSAVSWEPGQLQKVEMIERVDGSGDLVFEKMPGMKSGTREFGFLRVENVKEVDRVLCERLGAKHG